MDKGIFTLNEFKNRGVIKLAPDAIIKINTDTDAVVMIPSDKANFSEGISSINVNNVMDPPGGSSATIEIISPIYQGAHTKFWTNPSDYLQGKEQNPDYVNVKYPLFIPMSEIEILFKGRYLVGNEPKYYRVFWGYINTVEESYSSGMYRISLSCVDMLHWWSWVKINMHPTLSTNLGVGVSGGKQTLTNWQTIFYGLNPYQIIWNLSQNLGLDEWMLPDTLAKWSAPAESLPDNMTELANNIIGGYWEKRFKVFSSHLRMYGMKGAPSDLKEFGIDKEAGLIKDQPIKTYAEKEGAFLVDNVFFTKFQPLAALLNSGNFQEAEYMSKLEIAAETIKRAGMEFFQDVNGDFVIKPPFYNINTKDLLPYVVEPYDIITASFSVNPDEFITALTVLGVPLGNLGFQLPRIGYHIDVDLINKYGMRYQEVIVDWLSDTEACKTLAVGEMSRLNAKGYRGSLAIPGRPELRMGYPVYVPHRDSFHYITGITHNFTYGGNFTTTLTLIGERKKEFRLVSTKNSKNTILMKNKIYQRKNRQDAIEQAEIERILNSFPATTKPTTEDIKAIYLKSNRGLISYDLPGDWEIKDQRDDTQNSVTSYTAPFTDEEGYRIIGGFAYGRGIVLTKDNPGITETAKEQTAKDSAISTVIGSGQESDKMSAIIATSAQEDGKDSAVNKFVKTSYLQSKGSLKDPVLTVVNAKPQDSKG